MKLIKFLTKIKRAIFGPKTEIEFVEASLKRHRWKLEDLRRQIGDDFVCCHDCASGGEYSRIADKIDRIEHRLKVLYERKNRNKRK